VLYAPNAAASLRLDGAVLDVPAGAAIQLRTETAARIAWVSGFLAIAIITPRPG
jgi:hypothetical protein